MQATAEVAFPSGCVCTSMARPGWRHRPCFEDCSRGVARILNSRGCGFSGRRAPCPTRHSPAGHLQVKALLFDPPPFDPRKLSVSFLPGAAHLGAHPPVTRRYTLTHNDLTGALQLSIGPSYNADQLGGWYVKLIRDEVLAEWRYCSQGLASLHIHCHVSGEARWVATPSLRNYIFQREMPLVLDTIRHADRQLLDAFPQLGDAPVFVHMSSHVTALNVTLDWGRLCHPYAWRRPPQSFLQSFLQALAEASNASSTADSTSPSVTSLRTQRGEATGRAAAFRSSASPASPSASAFLEVAASAPGSALSDAAASPAPAIMGASACVAASAILEAAAASSPITFRTADAAIQQELPEDLVGASAPPVQLTASRNHPCGSHAPACPANSGAGSGAGPRQDEVVRLATPSVTTSDGGVLLASAAGVDFSVDAQFTGTREDPVVRPGTTADMTLEGDALLASVAGEDFSVEAEFAATAASLGVRPPAGLPVAEAPLPARQVRSDSPARTRTRADSPARTSGGDARPGAIVLDGEGDARGQTAVVLSARFVGKWLADGHEVVMVRRRPLEWSSAAGAERPAW